MWNESHGGIRHGVVFPKMCSSKIIASTILLLNATDMNVMYVFDDSILFFRVFVYLIYGIKTYLTYFRLRSETLTVCYQYTSAVRKRTRVYSVCTNVRAFGNVKSVTLNATKLSVRKARGVGVSRCVMAAGQICITYNA